MDRNKKITIIGAGLAGLTTGYRLLQQGIDIEIYEARERVGGRVFTVYLDKDPVELGGLNFYDGKDAFHLKALAQELGLKLCESKINLSQCYYDPSGITSIEPLLKQLPFSPEELKKKLQEIASTSSNMKEVFEKLFPKNDLLRKVLSIRLSAYEGGDLSLLSPLYIETLYHMLLGGVAPAHPEAAAKGISLATIQGGNSRLPEKMAEALQGRIHLGQRLVSVSKSSERKIALSFADRKSVETDLLVLTIPCPTYETIDFQDEVIPQKILQNIQSIRYGLNAKILVPLSSPCSEEVGCMSEKSIAFSYGNASHVTLYLTGNASKFSPKTLENVYWQETPMLSLRWKEDFSSSPLAAQDKAFAHYKVPVGHSWAEDPYAKGSYSYISSGQEDLWTSFHREDGELTKALFAALDQTVYFAGEHTSILPDAIGTMEAACESGERTARMIQRKLFQTGAHHP